MSSLLLLLLTLSPLTLVNSSVSPPTRPDILDNFMSRAVEWFSPTSSDCPQQQIQNSISMIEAFKKNYFKPSTPLSVRKISAFWLIVENFLNMLSRSFNPPSPMSEQNALILLNSIEECLNRIREEVNAKPRSESSQTNTDNFHNAEIVQFLKAFSAFQNLMKTSVFFFQPVPNKTLHSARVNILKIEFELIRKAFKPESEPFSAHLNHLFVNHFRFCCQSLSEQIEENRIHNICLIGMPKSISTKIQEIKVWMDELKSHALQTTVQLDIAATVESYKELQKKSLKFWSFTHQFLSLVLDQFNGRKNHPGQVLIFFSIIRAFNSEILCLLKSSNFHLLEKVYTALPTYSSKVVGVIDFGGCLNLLSHFIGEVCFHLFDFFPTTINSPLRKCLLNRLKFMLHNDRISFSKDLQRLWPLLDYIPKANFNQQSEAIIEKFVSFEKLPLINEIGREIKELKFAAWEMKNEMNQYTSQMNDSDPSKFLSVNISRFWIRDCIWCPIERVLTKYLQWMEAPPFTSEEHHLEVRNRIQENMKTLKADITKYFNDTPIQLRRYRFDQTVQIMECVAVMIKIKMDMANFYQLSKINIFIELEEAGTKLTQLWLNPVEN